MIFWRLFRLPLALANGLSALAGYLLFPAPVTPWSMAGVVCGVALLAAGGSALNQVLERDLDRLMVRTMGRPIPTGQLSPWTGATTGVAAIAAGGVILALAGGLMPAFLGGMSLSCYLGLYTPLKRRTTLALLVGGVSGAVAPIIGWTVAGADPLLWPIWLLAGLVYLWQIPHFWLLQHRFADDYRRAGIPLLADTGGPIPSGFLCLLWGIALFTATMLLPLLGMVGKPATVALAGFFVTLPILSRLGQGRMLFGAFNAFPLVLPVLFLMQR